MGVTAASDLSGGAGFRLQAVPGEGAAEVPHRAADVVAVADHLVEGLDDPAPVDLVDGERRQQRDDVAVVAGNLAEENGRASCRERVGQYGKIWVVAVSLKKKQKDENTKIE